MNTIRTAFRIVYSISFVSCHMKYESGICNVSQFTAAIDEFTSAKRINSSAFWSDLLYVLGQFSYFAATCLSVIVSGTVSVRRIKLTVAF